MTRTYVIRVVAWECADCRESGIGSAFRMPEDTARDARNHARRLKHSVRVSRERVTWLNWAEDPE